jgi:hypothetical protein
MLEYSINGTVEHQIKIRPVIVGRNTPLLATHNHTGWFLSCVRHTLFFLPCFKFPGTMVSRCHVIIFLPSSLVYTSLMLPFYERSFVQWQQ